jgi:hypothetical protein
MGAGCLNSWIMELKTGTSIPSTLIWKSHFEHVASHINSNALMLHCHALPETGFGAELQVVTRDWCSW